jgi:maleylacetate reductase
VRFVHESPAARVLFGEGRRHEAAAELARIGERPLLIVDAVAASVATDVHGALAELAVAAIEEVRQHVPLADAEAARALAVEAQVDCLVALGGGSAVGLAKAVALTSGLPLLAVPTTYAGSEMTPVWGITEAGEKRTGRDPVVAPRVVVYDPQLTWSLPPAVTAASGLNAIAHCVDALWAGGRTPLTDLMAERGIALLAAGLPGSVRRGDDPASRAEALAGAWLAGATFGIAGGSLHHKLCHVLGGRYDLPHAETHAAVLPWAAALAIRHVPDAGVIVARALGAADPVEGLVALATSLGAPSALEPYGLSEKRALAVADEVPLDTLATSFKITRDELRELLLGAAGRSSR